MARTGRPPKPAELKRKQGNPGKRALPVVAEVVALPAAQGVPEPLEPLGATGMRMWTRLWNLGAVWISPATDMHLVQQVCELADERAALRLRVLRDADPQERRGLRAVDEQMLKCLSLLGFTPTDRTRLGLAEVKTMTKLQQLRANR